MSNVFRCNEICEESVDAYLRQHPEYLTRKVEAMPIEILHEILTRRIVVNAFDGHSFKRVYKYQIKPEPTDLNLKIFNDSVDEIKRNHMVLWEVAKCLACTVGCDDICVFKCSNDKTVTQYQILTDVEIPPYLRIVKLGKYKYPTLKKVFRDHEAQIVNNNHKDYPGSILSSVKRARNSLFVYFPVAIDDFAIAFELIREDFDFLMQEIPTITGMVHWCCLIVEFAAANRRLRIQRNFNLFLLETVKTLFKVNRSVDDLIRKFLSYTLELIEADQATLFLINEAKDQLISPVFDVGKAGTSEASARQPLGVPIKSGIAGYVAQTGETVNIANVYLDSRFDRSVDTYIGDTTCSMLCLPINYNDEILGVLQMLNTKETKAFGDCEVQSLQTLAIYCGIAVHNASIYAKIKQSDPNYRVALDELKHRNVCEEEGSSSD